MPDRKPRTRANREGRPYQRKSDGLWVATVYLPDGTRKTVSGKTRKKALEKQQRARREIDDGLPVTVGRGDTLGRYLTQVWLKTTLPQRVAAGRLRESTADWYRIMAETHIIPHLGAQPLAGLSTAHIRAWLLELAGKPSAHTPRKSLDGEGAPPRALSATTVRRAHATLRRALADAVADEIIKRNVCLLVAPPSPGRTTRVRELTREEVRALLAAAAGHRLWAYWVVLLALGLRRGEGLGLRWEDVDLDAGTARLRESVRRVRFLDPETGRRVSRLVATPLKTEESKATMRLPAFAVAALREHRAAQEEERRGAAVWADAGRVFTTGVGTLLEPRAVSRMWAEICDRSGVGRCRVHDLRHACGSLLFGAGVDLKTIQGLLRHTRLSTTSDVYVHLLDEVRDGAAAMMDGVLVDLAAERDRRSAS